MVTKIPRKTIKRDGEYYAYAGSVPKDLQKLTRALKNEAGRKVIFVDGESGTVRAYISKIFYASMCKVKTPWHGRGTLK